MKRLMLLAVALLPACAPYGHRVASVPDDPEPLDVAIVAPVAGQAGFWVNQPAHVAMFDIGYGGVRMLYPRFEGDLNRMVRAGSSFFSNVAGTRYASYFQSRMLDNAHYIFVVASRAPLNISSVVRYRTNLEYRVHVAEFGVSPLGTANTLIEEVIPQQAEEDWATAFYVVYPQLDWRRGRGFYQLVYCADGQIYAVDLRTEVFFCPRGGDTAAARDTLRPPGGFVVSDSARSARRYIIEAFKKKNDLLFEPAASDQLKKLYSRPSYVVERPPEVVLGRPYSPSVVRSGWSERPLREPGQRGNEAAYVGNGSQGTYSPQPQSGSMPPLQPQGNQGSSQGSNQGSGSNTSTAKGGQSGSAQTPR